MQMLFQVKELLANAGEWYEIDHVFCVYPHTEFGSSLTAVTLTEKSV